MKIWKGAAVGLAGIWVMIRGPPIGSIPGELLNGLMIGSITAFVFRRMLEGEFSLQRGIKKIVPMTKYLTVFARELVLANIDVAKRLLHPDLPIHPEVLRYRLSVENPLAVTMLANSITLTPGTLTMDHHPETGELEVHAINGGENPDEVTSTIRTWEELLEEIFDGEKT